MHALVRFDLSGTHETRLSLSEFEYRRGQYVDLGARIPMNGGMDCGWLSVEQHSGHVDRIAADIHQGTTAEGGNVADVVRVIVEVREPDLDGSQFSNCFRTDEIADLRPRRVETVHERLHELHPFRRADIDHRLGFCR